MSASLSSRGGRYIVIALVLLWTIPTFGVLVSSFRPEKEVKTSGWWKVFIRPKFTLANYDAVLSSSPGSANLTALLLQLDEDHDPGGGPVGGASPRWPGTPSPG